ncbi:MAG TPA: hypothetical protein ENH94_00370, partial [Phycisphaerales bacterium]|nr:hypothetical protein [Phycisphaerales bacterium]
MSENKHTPEKDLTHNGRCGMVGECQSNHTSVKPTGKQTLTSTKSRADLQRAIGEELAASAEARQSAKSGKSSKQPPLPHTAENANAAENLSQGSSPLTISTAMEKNTEKRLAEGGDCTNGSPSKDTQETTIASCATTATVPEGNTASVRTKANSFTP